MKFYIRYLSVWALNSALIIAAATYYSSSYVLGNAIIPPVTAGIFTGFLLTVFDRLPQPLFTKFEIKTKGRLVMFIFYWLVNSVGIWIIARLSFLSGFGIVSFFWAFTLGFIVCLGQWALRQLFKSLKLLEKK